MEAGSSIGPLTGLRSVLAWWVVAYHFAPRSDDLLGRVIACGHVAVDVFFVLSGYALTKRYVTADLEGRGARRAFWLRRFARLYPLYVVSLLLGLAAALPGSLTLLATPAGQLRIALQLLGLNAWWHGTMFSPNWAAWSLSVELFFYVVFPFLLPALRRVHTPQLLGLTGLCWALLFVAPACYEALDPDRLGRPLGRGDEVFWSWYLKFFPLQRLPEFVAGMIAALLVERGLFVSVRRHRPAASLAGLALVASMLIGRIPLTFLYAGVSLPLVLALLVSLDRDAPGWLGRRGFVALGEASYATYILHVPLFLALARLTPELREDWLHFAGYGALFLPISLLMHAFVERPLRRRMVESTLERTRGV